MTPQRLAELHALLDDAATDDDLAHSRTGLALLEGLREVLGMVSSQRRSGLWESPRAATESPFPTEAIDPEKLRDAPTPTLDEHWFQQTSPPRRYG